jgi:predicted TPR repeat methyltransferase
MPARLFLSSGDLMADRRFDFARDLQLIGDLAAAADLLLQATELAPGFASAWFTLGDIRERLGEREAAIAAFRKAQVADPDDRHGASLRLMLLGAEPLSSMPPAYVRALFDQYARKFEAALVDDLGYRGPALLFKAVRALRSASPHFSSERSISAAAPGLPPPHSRPRSMSLPASICRRA